MYPRLVLWLRPFAERRNDARATNLVVGGAVLPVSPPGVESAVASKECVMDEPSDRMQDPAKRAERYEKVAAEFSELAKAAASPFLRAYYQRIAEQYRKYAQGELRDIEQDGAAARERAAT
jgi:hypothetical protein